MSSTLIDSVRSVFTGALLTKFSGLLGEPEAKLQKAVNAAIPMVLTDIVYKSYIQEQTPKIWNLSKQAASGDFLGQIHELTITSGGLMEGSVLLNKGGQFAKSLLSPRTDAVIGEVRRYAGVSIPNAAFITSVVSFAALDAIGRHIANNNADANGMASWLKTQGDSITHSIPTGLQVKETLGIQHYPWEKRATPKRSTALYAVLALVILVVIGFLIYENHAKNETAVVTDSAVTDTAARVQPTATAGVQPTATAGVDTLSSTVQVPLPNGKILDAHKGGTEVRLVHFLKAPNEKLDKKNGNWFDFTQIGFPSNGSSLLSVSETQLNNIVAILDAFPKAKIKIGGYTDNTGDPTENVRLSRQRAGNVEEKLKELGANRSQLAGSKGYGPKYPVGDNSTAEGRAMNRRMSIDVVAK